MKDLFARRLVRYVPFSWGRWFLVVAAILVPGPAARALGPGASLFYWKPELVPGLSKADIAYLNTAHCLIESYRTDQDAGPRKSAAPDENDLMMLLRGEFAAKGQTDLVVYCKSTEGKDAFFLVK
jgi:hypothetical protein